MLLNALEGLSFLTDEVTKLREANDRLGRENARAFAQQAGIIASLRAEVRSLRGERLPRADPKPVGPLPPEQPPLPLPAACSLPPASPSTAPELDGAPPTPTPRRGLHSSFAAAVAKSGGTTSTPEQLTPAPATSAVSPEVHCDDSAITNKRSGRAACVGASDSCRISVVQRSKRPRHIFVSKLSPCTTSAQLTEHLSTVHIVPLACQRLKTKYTSYSSFCVTVDEVSFQRLGDPLLWPKGCLYKPFRGKLHADMLCPTDIQNDD